MPPGQPYHMPTRGPSRSAPVSGHSTQHDQAYSPHRRTQNERHLAVSVQIKTRWLGVGPRHIPESNNHASLGSGCRPQNITHQLTHALFVASAATVPSRSWLATCLRRRAYVLLVACRSGEHLHGSIVAAESARHPALSPITAKLLSTDRVSCVKYC